MGHLRSAYLVNLMASADTSKNAATSARTGANVCVTRPTAIVENASARPVHPINPQQGEMRCVQSNSETLTLRTVGDDCSGERPSFVVALAVPFSWVRAPTTMFADTCSALHLESMYDSSNTKLVDVEQRPLPSQGRSRAQLRFPEGCP